jgi:hypothetical protein
VQTVWSEEVKRSPATPFESGKGANAHAQLPQALMTFIVQRSFAAVQVGLRAHGSVCSFVLPASLASCFHLQLALTLSRVPWCAFAQLSLFALLSNADRGYDVVVVIAPGGPDADAVRSKLAHFGVPVVDASASRDGLAGAWNHAYRTFAAQQDKYALWLLASDSALVPDGVVARLGELARRFDIVQPLALPPAVSEDHALLTDASRALGGGAAANAFARAAGNFRAVQGIVSGLTAAPTADPIAEPALDAASGYLLALSSRAVSRLAASPTQLFEASPQRQDPGPLLAAAASGAGLKCAVCTSCVVFFFDGA